MWKKFKTFLGRVKANVQVFSNTKYTIGLLYQTIKNKEAQIPTIKLFHVRSRAEGYICIIYHLLSINSAFLWWSAIAIRGELNEEEAKKRLIELLPEYGKNYTGLGLNS